MLYSAACSLNKEGILQALGIILVCDAVVQSSRHGLEIYTIQKNSCFEQNSSIIGLLIWFN